MPVQYKVVVTWDAMGEPVDEMLIYRGLPGGNPALLAHVPSGTTFEDTNVSYGSTYVYTVVAKRQSDESPGNAKATVAVRVPPPKDPANVQAVVVAVTP